MVAVNLEVVVREVGVTGAETLFIGQLILVGMLRIEYNMVCQEMRDWLGAGDSQCWDDAVCSVSSSQLMLYSVYAVLGVCCTRSLLYLVYAVLGGYCTRCMLYSVYAVLGVCCTRCMLYMTLTLDHRMER
jgi:hypothetical protein